MNTNQNNVGRGFWLRWVLATIAGFIIGALLGVYVAYGLFDRDGSDATIGITAGIVMGGTGGCLQWLVLREKIARAGWWVLASTLGFAITLGILGVIGIGESNESYVMAGILFAVVFGVAGGILQWLVLRRAEIAHAGLWMLASILGADGNYALSGLVFGLFLGVGLGAISGAMLVWLLRQSPSSSIKGLATAH